MDSSDVVYHLAVMMNKKEVKIRAAHPVARQNSICRVDG
jgi:phosphoribosyl-ATP pyrophosphohydrolase